MVKIEERSLTPRIPLGDEAATREGARSTRRGRDATPLQANGPAFFTVAQLAVRWGLSERQVHRFTASGEVAVTRFGKSVRISGDEVARFEADCAHVK